VFDNFHLRGAMQMANDAVQALTEFGRKGKALIASTCDLPGKIVINDRSGDDSGNYAGKVAFLHSDQRDKLIEMLKQKGESYTGDLPARIIFDGKKQPMMLDNPQFAYLLQKDRWLSAAELEDLARRPLWDDGFNAPGWFAGEAPRATWLGQDFSVRGQAMLILRRRISENVMMIGDANAERYGMMAALLSSLALNVPPVASQFVLMDCGIPGTPWGNALRDVCQYVLKPAGFTARFTQSTAELQSVITELVQEIDRRLQLNPGQMAQYPDIYVAATELDRVDPLRRQVGSYGMATESALGEQFARLYVEGPPVGVHLILSFSGVRPLASVVDTRSGLDYFRHRVATQMSEDASHTLIRSRLASRLQTEGPSPVCALYFDVESDHAVRFKPYTTKNQPDEDNLQKQLTIIGEQLASRKEGA
jgi:DNA segregation ATPase FtsK/SpoIIIE, S-DNA-T family